MASIYASATDATVSLFDAVTDTATAARQLLGTGILAIDALDRKTKVMHTSVVADTNMRITLIPEVVATEVASDHADTMEAHFKKNFPGKEFDREAFYLATLAKLTAKS